MKTNHFKNLCSGLLIVLITWPIIHIFLVNKYDVDPWELFGFAMYTTPHKIDVQLSIHTPKNKKAAIASPLSDNLRSQFNDFIDKRSVLGQFHRPDELCKNILRSNKAFIQVTIKIDTIRLDGKTGMLTSTVKEYHYQQP